MLENKAICRYLDMLVTAFGKDIINFLEDNNIIEIMLNPDGCLWLESHDRGKYFSGLIIDSSRAANIVKLVAAYHQGIADQEHPEVACEIPMGGGRFQGWLPPVVAAPTFAIRKRATQIFTLDDYVQQGTLTAEEARCLKGYIRDRKNILIAGGTSSGKTTFANALLNELKDSKERIIVLEDLPELQIKAPDCVKLTSTNEVSMRDLVKGILRMRPDRIIIGEVRDGSALELLKAWNTGHPGGICTIHANSPQATLARIGDLVREAANIDPTRLIEEAIQVVVFMQRTREGKHQVSSITEFVSE